MPLFVWLAAAAVASSIPLLLWALSAQREGHHEVRGLLSEGGRVAIEFDTDLSGSAWSRLVGPMLATLARRSRALTPLGVTASLERKLHYAGTPANWPIERVLALKVLLGGTGLAIGLLLFAALTGPLAVIWLILAPLGGYQAVDIYLQIRADARQDAIRRALPDLIDQISISVDAGLGFEAALSRSAQAGEGPLAEELVRTLQDMQLGQSRYEALNRLVSRTDVADLRAFVSAIRQAEQYGVPVADVLRLQALELREKRRSRAEESAMQIPVKMIFPMLLCILPVLFIVVLGPAAIRLVDQFG